MPRGFGHHGFHGGFGRGWYGMRRGGFGMGGWGMGGSLLSILLGGGLGYLLGSNQNQQDPQQSGQYYPQTPTAGASDDVYAQLKLLGELHESGVLSDAEFENEKYRILNRR